MKHVLITLLLVLFILAGCSQNPVTSEQNTLAGSAIPHDFTGSKPVRPEASTLLFEGYGIGKSHEGTFTDWQGELFFENGKLVGATGTIQTASVTTDIASLDNHLRDEDFLDVTTYPVITITSTSLSEGVMTALLSFKGTTKEISFPVTITENSISSDFLLDVTDFSIDYVGIKKDVRIAFTMKP